MHSSFNSSNINQVCCSILRPAGQEGLCRGEQKVAAHNTGGGDRSSGRRDVGQNREREVGCSLKFIWDVGG